MIYSGYTIEELREKGGTAKKILDMIDILVDGRFEVNNTNRKIWRGSDNQRLHIMSERAKKYSAYAEKEYGGRRELFLEEGKDYSLRIIGIPERGFMNLFKRRCEAKGINVTGGV
jgi:hypothetical protein